MPFASIEGCPVEPGWGVARVAGPLPLLQQHDALVQKPDQNAFGTASRPWRDGQPLLLAISKAPQLVDPKHIRSAE